MDNRAIRPGIRAQGLAYHGLLALRQNDLAQALSWKDHLTEHKQALGFPARHCFARLLIAQGDTAGAMEWLESCYQNTVQVDAQGMMLQIRVYQALAAEAPAEGLAFLSEALTLGQPEGYIRTFVDEGKLLAPLLRKALAQGVTPEYTAKLLNIIEAEERQRQAKNGGMVPTSSPPGLLSGRELEVLRLLATGLSNSQIAERLIISLATAKTHIHNISVKLNAKTRTEAIARARELKLI
jgi:LuxR family maltose regulon positive regulatory protein